MKCRRLPQACNVNVPVEFLTPGGQHPHRCIVRVCLELQLEPAEVAHEAAFHRVDQHWLAHIDGANMMWALGVPGSISHGPFRVG